MMVKMMGNNEDEDEDEDAMSWGSEGQEGQEVSGEFEKECSLYE